jgi:hypothetical protein
VHHDPFTSAERLLQGLFRCTQHNENFGGNGSGTPDFLAVLVECGNEATHAEFAADAADDLTRSLMTSGATVEE